MPLRDNVPVITAIDYTARSDAQQAHTRINEHERQCAERWAQTLKALDTLNQRLWMRDGAIIIALLGTLGAFLVRGL